MAIGITVEEAKAQGLSYEDASASARNVPQGVATDKAYGAISDQEDASIDSQIADAPEEDYRGYLPQSEDTSGTAMDYIKQAELSYAPMIHEQALTEEAFYASNLRMVVDPEADILKGKEYYHKTRSDLITKGTSPEIATLYKDLGDFTTQLDREAVLLVMQDSTIPNEVKTETIKRFMRRGGDFPDLREEYINSIAAKQAVVDEAANKPLDMQFLQDRIDWNREEAALKNGVASQFDPSIAAGLAGLLEIMIPFVDQANVKYLESQITGPESLAGDIGSILFFGENKKALRDTLLAMPFDKRKEATKKLIETISMLPGGDYKKMLYLEAFTGTGEYSTFERVLDDIIGAIDATIVLAPVAKLLSRAGKGLLRPHAASALESARLASQDEAVELALSALADGSDDVAHAIGVTKNEIAAQYFLPKMSTEVTRELTPELLIRSEEIEVLHKALYDQLETAGINYTKAEKEASLRNIVEELKEVDGLTLYMGSSKLEPKFGGTIAATDGESLFGTAVYGKTEKRGFATVAEATERAVEAGISPTDFTILQKNPKTGELDPVVAVTKEEPSLYGGNYYVSRKFSRAFDSRDAALYGGDSVTSAGRLKYASFVADVTAKFDNWFARAALKAADNGTAIEKQLLDVAKKDISSLKRDEKSALFLALEKGAEGEGKIYTVSELKTIYGMNDKAINGYYTFRKLQDLTWFQTNRRFRKELAARGMKEVTGLDKDLGKQFGAPVSVEGAARVKFVFDAKQNKVVQVTPEYIKEMYGKGNQFVVMESSIKGLDSITTHLLLDNSTTTLKALPENPLPYIEGYYQRSYKEYYFLDRVPKTGLRVDGEYITNEKILQTKYGSADSAGSHKKRMEAKAAEMNAALESTDDYYYHVRKANELGDADVKELRMQNSYKNATKGRSATRLAGDMDHTFATIEDPMESLFRNIRTMSKYVAMDDFMSSAKQRWVNTYGTASGGKFPSSFDDVATGILSTEDYANARAIHNQLGMMHSVASVTDIRWKDFILSASEVLEGGMTDILATGVRKLADVSPTAFTRSLSSTLFIALAPQRQLVIQPAQLLQLTAITPKYIASGAMSRELLALSLSRASWGNPELVKKANQAGAKLFGVTEKEYEVIAKQYLDKSGLPYSVDSHIYIDGVVKDIHRSHLDSTASKVVTGVMAPFRTLVSVSKQVGFDVGEFINLTGSWLVARRRWMDANPEFAGKWADKQYSDVIDADARAISYAMTQPGTFAYQQGLLSIPLQFMSVPHKAFLSMAPEWMGGSKTYTQLEKNRLIFVNFILMGGTGLGIDSAIDYIFKEAGVELSTDAMIAIRGGMMDIGMNAILRTLSDDKADPTAVRFADAFAPVADGVIPGVELMMNLWDGRMSAMVGPSFQAAGKFKDVYDMFHVLTEKPDMSTTDKVIEALVSVGRLSSGFDAGIKSMIARNAGIFVSKSGDPIVEATYQEAMMKMFGLSTYSEDAVWKATISSSNRRKTAQDWAKVVHSAYNNERLWKGEGSKAELEELISRYKALEGLVDPDILPLAYEEIVKLERRSQQTLGHSITGSMMREATNSVASRETVLNEIDPRTLPQKTKDFMHDILTMGNE